MSSLCSKTAPIFIGRVRASWSICNRSKADFPPAFIRRSARTRPARAGFTNTLIVDHNHRYSLADLRSLQDWFLRYQLETVPGVAEVASIGGFVRQYQVQLDPNKLLAYNIPLSTVIDRVETARMRSAGACSS